MRLWKAGNTTSSHEQSAEAKPPEFSIRPEQLEKLAPCQASCPNSGDIRGWLGIIAQRKKTGLSLEEAYDRAWRRLAEFNPLPATLGRICPHPCEDACTRRDKDGAVAINVMERFLGDWGLERDLELPRLEDAQQNESVGVIGSGPAGLSFAYQMARRGYPVTVYDSHTKPGGMLHYGIPDFRLPPDVLAGEIQRLSDFGIAFELGAEVGTAVTVESLRRKHRLLFLGMGAQRARGLGIPGEEGPGVYSGIEYLRLRNKHQPVPIGQRVAVVGGGNTAIDAARVARRDGAEVALLYRRTREEMPAISTEVDEALAEGVRCEFLAAPTAILREGDAVKSVVFQKMKLGEPDESGRRRPVPVPGDKHDLAVETVILAVSQEPDLSGFGVLRDVQGWVDAGGEGRISDGLYAGGDDLGLGIASLAVSQGRHAADAAHAELRGIQTPAHIRAPSEARDFVKMEFYDDQAPVAVPHMSADDSLVRPDAEITKTISSEEAEHEAARCLSCGSCFGCQQCWMYCNAGGLVRLKEVGPGSYYAFITDICEGCGKCIEICPSGFLSTGPGIVHQ